MKAKRQRLKRFFPVFGRYKKIKLKDLSDYEDIGGRSFLNQVGALATRNALNENKALGIPNTFWKDGQVFQRMPDGSISPVQASGYSQRYKQGRKLTIGSVFHVKK